MNSNSQNGDIENKSHSINNEIEDIGELYLYRWIDCKDYQNKWYEAQIIDTDFSNGHKRIKVHFKGWKSKFDEWIDLNRSNDQIRPLHTFTERPQSFGKVTKFNIGTKIDCKDSTDQWYEAEIVDETQKLVKVHYLEWSDQFDEWINKDSYRIAPLHAVTKPKTHQQSQNANNTNNDHSSNKISQHDGKHSIHQSFPIDRNRGKSQRSNTSKDNSNNDVVFINNTNDGIRNNNFYSRPVDVIDESQSDNDSNNNANQNYCRNSNTNNNNKFNNNENDEDDLKNPINDHINQNDQKDQKTDENQIMRQIEHNLKSINHILNHNGNNLSEEMKKKLKNAKIRLDYLSKFRPTRKNEEDFRKLIKNKGLEIVNMGDDGNCLFRSISFQIYGTQDYHSIVREKVVEYLENESEYFSNFIEGGKDKFRQYCQRMRTNAVYGDNLEIQAISEIYNRPIEIYAYNDEPLKIYSNDTKTSPNNSNRLPIRLSYHFNAHYNSIIDPNLFKSSIEKRIPGDIENERIRLSKLRSLHSNNTKPTEMSDVELTDLQYFNMALEESRRSFHDSNMLYDAQIFDSAVQQSLEEDINKAVQISLQESEQNDIQKTKEISKLDLYPDAIKIVVNQGYSIEDAEEAFTMFSENKTMTQEQLIDNMIEFIKQKNAGYQFF